MHPLAITLIVILSIVLVLLIGISFFYFIIFPRLVIKKIRGGTENLTYPENYAELESKVEVIKNSKYPSKYPSNEFDLYLPKNIENPPLMLWVHGGGFIAGTKDGGKNVMTALSASGFSVISMNYALAPEFPYPTAIKQIEEMVRFIPEVAKSYSRVNANNMFAGGDSAGAQLIAQFAATQTNNEFRVKTKIKKVVTSPIKGLVLVCAPFNLINIRKAATGKLKMFVNIWGRAYFKNLFWHKSKAAKETVTGLAITKDYPPCFLTDGNTGSFEIQNRQLGATLKALNVPVTELYFDQTTPVPHEYLFNLSEQNSQSALKEITTFLNSLE